MEECGRPDWVARREEEEAGAIFGAHLDPKGKKEGGGARGGFSPLSGSPPARKSKSGKGKGTLFDIDGDDGSLRSGVSIFGVGGLGEAPCYSERKGGGGTWAVQYSGFELEWIEFLAFPETEEQKG